MKVNDTLIRDDGKVFKVIEPNHWSLVIAERGAEEDRVKQCADKREAGTYLGYYSNRKYKLVNPDEGVSAWSKFIMTFAAERDEASGEARSTRSGHPGATAQDGASGETGCGSCSIRSTQGQPLPLQAVWR